MTFETDLKAAIRTIPDYPKPGVMFRDITTLLGNARAFARPLARCSFVRSPADSSARASLARALTRLQIIRE